MSVADIKSLFKSVGSKIDCIINDSGGYGLGVIYCSTLMNGVGSEYYLFKTYLATMSKSAISGYLSSSVTTFSIGMVTDTVTEIS